MSTSTAKEFTTIVVKETAIVLATQATAITTLVAIGYVISKVQERKAKKAAK